MTTLVEKRTTLAQVLHSVAMMSYAMGKWREQGCSDARIMKNLALNEMPANTVGPTVDAAFMEREWKVLEESIAAQPLWQPVQDNLFTEADKLMAMLFTPDEVAEMLSRETQEVHGV